MGSGAKEGREGRASKYFIIYEEADIVIMTLQPIPSEFP